MPVPGPLELLILLPLVVIIPTYWLNARRRRRALENYAEGDIIEAAIWKRLTNCLADTAIITLVTLLLFTIGEAFDVPAFSGVPSAPLFVTFLYYFLFEAILQKTPGKYLTRTKVVLTGIGETSEIPPPTQGTIAKRTLIRFIPFEPLSGWWHDRWSGTLVVDDK